MCEPTVTPAWGDFSLQGVDEWLLRHDLSLSIKPRVLPTAGIRGAADLLDELHPMSAKSFA